MQYTRGKIVAAPQVGTKTVLMLQKPDVGGPEVHFICGKCNTMQVKGFDPNKYRNNVIRCMNCGEYNEV